MRLLLDQGLPRSAALILREKQIETAHVGELDMASASDDNIISYARYNGYTIVTLDADFHSLLALANAQRPSVIRIRVQRLKGQEVASLVSTVLERIGHELQGCSLITVTSTTIRIRRLPLIQTKPNFECAE
jgi:predicted nuclease of predicted toxin-antitoxin system